jgi:hypothetical protein
MSDDDFPAVVLEPVDLGAAKYTVISAPIMGSLHVLEIHRTSEVLADHRERRDRRQRAPGRKPIQGWRRPVAG